MMISRIFQSSDSRARADMQLNAPGQDLQHWSAQVVPQQKNSRSDRWFNLRWIQNQQVAAQQPWVVPCASAIVLKVSAKWRAPTSCGLEMRCPDTARLDLSCAVNDQNFQNGSGTQRKLLNMSLSGLFQHVSFISVSTRSSFPKPSSSVPPSVPGLKSSDSSKNSQNMLLSLQIINEHETRLHQIRSRFHQTTSLRHTKTY
jgi:hypothetical protein